MNKKILSVAVIVAVAVFLASVIFATPALTQQQHVYPEGVFGIAEEYKTITDIKKGEPVRIEMPEVHAGREKPDEVGTRWVVITFNRDVDKADLYGCIYSIKPDDWPVAPGDYVIYSDRTIISPPLTTIATVEYHTWTSKYAVERENLDPYSIMEYRMAEVAEKWLPQEIAIEDEDDKYYYTRSFSVFFPHTRYASSMWHPK